jgi:hypothetical protein
MVKCGLIGAKNGDMILPNLDAPRITAAPVRLEVFAPVARFVTDLSFS